MQAPKQKQRELVPADTHLAICYCVCDLGTRDVVYPGKPPKSVRQILIQWELPNCRMTFEDGDLTVEKPKVIGKTYTFSTFEGANLAQHITSWMGGCPNNFEFESLLGQSCFLSIIHKLSKSSGNNYANIASVMKVPEGVTVPELENPTIFYDMTAMGRTIPESLQGDNYSWLKEKIEASDEFRMIEHASQSMTEDTTDYGEDNIPF